MAEKPTDLLLAEDLQIAIRTKGQTLYPVNRLTLRIPSHTVVGLVGESGCGKSMTAMAIMGLLAPSVSISGGRIFFEGEEISAYTSK